MALSFPCRDLLFVVSAHCFDETQIIYVCFKKNPEWHVTGIIPLEDILYTGDMSVCICMHMCIYTYIYTHLQAAWCYCSVMLLLEAIDAVPDRVAKNREEGKERLISEGLQEEEPDTLLSFFSPHPTSLTLLHPGSKNQVVFSLLALGNLLKPLFSKHNPLLSIPVSPTNPQTSTHSLCPTTIRHEYVKEGQCCCHCSALLLFPPFPV